MDSLDQLILPTRCRSTVLKLVHDVPFAGHLGRRKTASRILQRFHWPGIFKSTCPECQKSTPRGPPKAPLVPLPVIDVPFIRAAMDFVGPLPHSSSGNHFILVLCDYATRYPETIPLRTTDADCIVKELVKIFACVGVPDEIFTEQGTNFTSQLLQEVYSLIKVKPIRTTPYHPQTDGLVECFNATLKSMLWKAASTDGKNWDELLPYLLFAYCELPQASTGFSPFELLYGCQVRGPLDILKESWEASPKSSESIISYVLLMQERLSKLKGLVTTSLQQAQHTQKTWYDKHARSHQLHAGDQVLVLLPTSTNKFLVEWQGPYTVTKQRGKVTYEVHMPEKRKRLKVFHINMLREWHSPTALSCWTEEIADDEPEGDDIVTWFDPQTSAPQIGQTLSQQQTHDIHSLCTIFSTILKDKPGRTSIIEHSINTDDAQPIRLPPYRIPHSYRDIVQTELKEMEEAGIIERSSSEWAAPICNTFIITLAKDCTNSMVKSICLENE